MSDETETPPDPLADATFVAWAAEAGYDLDVVDFDGTYGKSLDELYAQYQIETPSP